MKSSLWENKWSMQNAKWFLVCYTNSNKNVITAEGDLCPSQSFWCLCKYSKGLWFSLCGGNLSYHSVKAESICPLRSLKSLSSAVWRQRHLKEQSTHKRQMEAIRRPLHNSQSSKGHICIYFPRHKNNNYQDFATEGFVAKLSKMDFGIRSVLLDLVLPQLLCQTFLQIYGAGSNAAHHKAVSRSLCKPPCCFVRLTRHCSPASFPALLHSSMTPPQQSVTTASEVRLLEKMKASCFRTLYKWNTYS